MNFMDIKQISPDQVVFFQYHFITLNLTIVFTWAVMALLVIGSWLVTRRLSTEPKISAWQNILEILVTGIQDQISEISRQKAKRYTPFIGTLFVFIAACNLLTVVPGYESPTASLSTTAALAICVFISVPLFGIAQKGPGQLSQTVYSAHGIHAALQYHGGIVPDPGPGGQAFWQYHERFKDCGHSSGHHPLCFSGDPAVARTFDRTDSGLYFCGSGHGVYCIRHPDPGTFRYKNRHKKRQQPVKESMI
jgi:hypothetical protein